METKNNEHRWHISIEYSEQKERNFVVITEGSNEEAEAILTIITRGAIMATSAKRATAYNEEGFDVITYQY